MADETWTLPSPAGGQNRPSLWGHHTQCLLKPENVPASSSGIASIAKGRHPNPASSRGGNLKHSVPGGGSRQTGGCQELGRGMEARVSRDGGPFQRGINVLILAVVLAKLCDATKSH